jgi:hypothetical protein
MTSVELFELDGGPISFIWERKGGRYKPFADFDTTHGIYRIAESTVGIYLGLPTFEEQRWRDAEQRAEKRKARGKLSPKK